MMTEKAFWQRAGQSTAQTAVYASLIAVWFWGASSVVLAQESEKSMSDNLGVTNGVLTPCPTSPNCVCSQCPPEDTRHFITPVQYTVSDEALMEVVLNLLGETPRTRIVTASKNYVHAECKSLIMRFIDDLELYIDSNKKLLQFRSASRIGYSDLGVNRKRVEDFKQRLLARLNAMPSE